MHKIGRGEAEGRFLFLSLILTIIFFSPQPVLGAAAPNMTRILTIPNQTAGRVTSDATGNIYIADTVNKKVNIYTYTGEFEKTIALSYSPTALAVSSDNLLYVGENAQNGHCYIEVFSASGAPLPTMNATGPIAMAFLSTGEMYVVDGYKVKKFDAAMNKVLEFGGFTMFRDPSAFAISEQKGELYVLDMGGSATVNGYTNTPVWRVQVFDLNGGLLRSFSSFGYGADGMVGSASGIAVDKEGRIYVSDNVQSIVAVYDANGAFLQTIYDAVSPLFNPVNLFYKNDRLYIASLAGKFVTVYAIDGYSVLDAAPNPINVKWQSGMANPAKTLTISNSGTASLTWQATVDAASASWLGISQNTGTVEAKSGQDVEVTINTAGFAAGQTFTGLLTITAPGASKTVSVSVIVADPPTLTVSPASISIPPRRYNETTAPIPLTVTIGNDVSGGTLKWHASVASDVGWLSMLPLEGTSALITSPLVMIADAVQPGTFAGSITVTLDGATGSPVTVPVTLEVYSPASSITVNTNNSDAKFKISGPNGFSANGSGVSFTADGVSAGSYTVTYSRVAGFKSPASETKTVEVGQTATFTGNYTDLRQRMNIVASHGSRKNESNEVAIFKADGTLVFSFTPSMPYAYGVSTAVGDVDGDGAADILVGGAPYVVKGYQRNGVAIEGLEFSAYQSAGRSNAGGVNLAAADFDKDGRDEIITGDAAYSSVVRIFSYAQSAVSDTGVYLEPFKNLGRGVNVAAADLDGDGLPELVVLQAVSDVVPEVEIYKVNTAAGAGRWTADMTGRFNVCSTAASTNLAAADVDGDGLADIIVLCTHGKTSEVREFSGGGNLIASFTVVSDDGGSLAAGDINFDGEAEIVLGAAASAKNRTFSTLDSLGSKLITVPAFLQSYGVRVSVGNLAY